jgi:ankyrin repeat protein
VFTYSASSSASFLPTSSRSPELVVSLKDAVDFPIIDHFVKNIHPSVDRMFIDDGYINSVDSNVNTPLVHSIVNGTHSRTMMLLESGANPNIGTPLLHSVDQYGNKVPLDVIKLMIEKGADYTVTEPRSNQTVLYFARGEVLSYFLTLPGLKLESIGNRGMTPLMVHACLGHHAEVAILLEAGANVYHQSQQGGTTALHVALWRYDIKTARVLLDYMGTNIDIPSAIGITPIMEYSQLIQHNGVELDGDTKELMTELIQRGARLDHQCNLGNTILFGVVRDDILRFLLDAMGDDKTRIINIQNNSGETALYVAAYSFSNSRSNSSKICTTLVLNGANPYIRANNGRCPHGIMDSTLRANLIRP